MSLTLTNISKKLENLGACELSCVFTTSCCSLVASVLCCKSQGPGSILRQESCAMFYMFLMLYDIYGMVWYTQVLILYLVLTRKFIYLNNKIDLVSFQEGEEGELKSETIWTKNSHLLREAWGLWPGPSLKILANPQSLDFWTLRF